ncbi:MAG: response regulator [Actinomycetota bacterium]
MIRILIADDHAMVRAGLAQLLRQYGDLEIVGEAANGLEAVEQVSLLDPDLVLMDMSMPVMDGLEALKLVKQRNPRTHVVVLSTFQEPHQVSAAITSGASGYLVKDVEPEVLVSSIRAAVQGGAPLSPSVAASLLRGAAPAAAPAPQQASNPASLTPRELEILNLIVDGHSNFGIGRALGISEKTVKTHCSRLFQRLGVTDRTQAAVWAMRNMPRPVGV